MVSRAYQEGSQGLVGISYWISVVIKVYLERSSISSPQLLFVSASDIDLNVSGFTQHFVFVLSSSAVWTAGSVCSAVV